ncbi:DUF6080 domain-containing protein [Bergeyella sp. RCAD1439]|uniref:DUF6080 domain-containing protein n=1 Tax=Bergeyella anatis TaxID=3113737 RepID=UPI002E19DC4C|nr:DUF6080 domain-containing protein [Bergeyella sp. RCAD1439]
MNLLKKTGRCLRLILPSTLAEILLFTSLIAGYGTLATTIALDYRIIFDNRIPWDAYFSFDNRAIVMSGGGFERHPLANYFFGWIRELAFWLSGGKTDATFRLVLAWLSTLTISLSIVQVYKYLKNIIGLPMHFSLLLILFYAFFSTNILLAFTPETYTYTLLALVLFNHYAALKLQKDKPISTAALTLATVTTGGLTITNAAKIFIPLAFEKGIFKNAKRFAWATAQTLIAAGTFLLLYFYRLNFDLQRIFTKTGEQYEKFSNPQHVPLWDMASSWFFGGNILFASFITRDYHNKKGFEYKALFMDVYSSELPYVFVALLLLMILWSVASNLKNKLVWILFVSFIIDILIHCFLKFGLHTAYIYGGHFVFVYPLLLGWLYHRYKNKSTPLLLISILLVFMTAFLITNNSFRMQEFFFFLNKYYQ